MVELSLWQGLVLASNHICAYKAYLRRDGEDRTVAEIRTASAVCEASWQTSSKGAERMQQDVLVWTLLRNKGGDDMLRVQQRLTRAELAFVTSLEFYGYPPG